MRCLPTRILGVVLGVAAPLTGFASDAGSPRVACSGDGRCVVSRLPPALAEPEAQAYLRSGLTTTLLLTLSGRGAGRERLSASVPVEVRFEPWEEVFHVLVRRPGAAPARHRLPSDDALREWWKSLRLDLSFGTLPQGRAQLELVVIPFSEEEEADTRRWYAESLREAGAGAGRSPGLGDALDAMTLSSIKRRGVMRRSWSARVEAAP